MMRKLLLRDLMLLVTSVWLWNVAARLQAEPGGLATVLAVGAGLMATFCGARQATRPLGGTDAPG